MIQDPLLRSLAASLYKEGWTPQEIAAELEIDTVDVIEYCNKLV